MHEQDGQVVDVLKPECADEIWSCKRERARAHDKVSTRRNGSAERDDLFNHPVLRRRQLIVVITDDDEAVSLERGQWCALDLDILFGVGKWLIHANFMQGGDLREGGVGENKTRRQTYKGRECVSHRSSVSRMR